MLPEYADDASFCTGFVHHLSTYHASRDGGAGIGRHFLPPPLPLVYPRLYLSGAPHLPTPLARCRGNEQEGYRFHFLTPCAGRTRLDGLWTV